MNDDDTKKILADAFFKELELVWSLVKFVSSIEAAALAGWYLLSQDRYLLSVLLLFASTQVLYFILTAVRRHVILLERFRRKLGPAIYPAGEQEQDEYCFGIKMRGHVAARMAILYLMIINVALAFFTLVSGAVKFQICDEIVIGVGIGLSVLFWCFGGKLFRSRLYPRSLRNWMRRMINNP